MPRPDRAFSFLRGSRERPCAVTGTWKRGSETSSGATPDAETRRLAEEILRADPAGPPSIAVVPLPERAPADSGSKAGDSSARAHGPGCSITPFKAPGAREPLLWAPGGVDAIAAFLGNTAETDTRILPVGGRLLTLTGPAGCGKTRLALEVAWRLAALREGMILFVPLAGVQEPGHLPDAHPSEPMSLHSVRFAARGAGDRGAGRRARPADPGQC